MALVALAESARDVAICLDKFLEHLPENSTEITALISECYAISSALRELSTAKDDPLYYRGYLEITQDVNVVLRSLDYTFHDVHRLFGGLGRTSHLTTSRPSSSSARFEDLQDRTEELLEVQETRLESTFNHMSLSDPGTARQRSFERRRPPGLSTPIPDPPLASRPGVFAQAPDPPQAGRARVRRPGPQVPLSPGFDQDFAWAPPVPDVPLSPTTTTTYSTHSSAASSCYDHWLPRLFDQSRPTTRFRDPGVVSACYGPDLPGASERLADEYTKLQDLYVATPLLKTANYVYGCTFDLLTSEQESIAEFYAMAERGSSVAFRLVLFYCAFLALRSEDAGEPLRRIDDHELHREKSIFAGQVFDFLKLLS
ncbi:MAG: hypothetical protein Q9190_004421 [Brigantiaea leucoxantha]